MTSYLKYKQQMAVLDADGDIETWITVKGNHIPIMKGQSKEEAVKAFIEKKSGKESAQRESKPTSIGEATKKVVKQAGENKAIREAGMGKLYKIRPGESGLKHKYDVSGTKGKLFVNGKEYTLKQDPLAEFKHTAGSNVVHSYYTDGEKLAKWMEGNLNSDDMHQHFSEQAEIMSGKKESAPKTVAQIKKAAANLESSAAYHYERADRLSEMIKTREKEMENPHITPVMRKSIEKSIGELQLAISKHWVEAGKIEKAEREKQKRYNRPVHISEPLKEVVAETKENKAKKDLADLHENYGTKTPEDLMKSTEEHLVKSIAFYGRGSKYEQEALRDYRKASELTGFPMKENVMEGRTIEVEPDLPAKKDVTYVSEKLKTPEARKLYDRIGDYAKAHSDLPLDHKEHLVALRKTLLEDNNAVEHVEKNFKKWFGDK